MPLVKLRNIKKAEVDAAWSEGEEPFRETNK